MFSLEEHRDPATGEPLQIGLPQEWPKEPEPRINSLEGVLVQGSVRPEDTILPGGMALVP